jgi:hypothetical protein
VNDRRMRRRVEQAATGALAGAHRDAVRAHLRAEPDDRAVYDRIIDAYRVLEGRAVSRAELDLVHEWLFDGSLGAEAPAQAHTPWLRAWITILAAVATAAFLVIGPLRPEEEDALRPKGGRASVLTIEALCGTTVSPLRPASEGCALDGSLSFAYRVAPSHGGFLSLFGLDEEGHVNYYVPTPVDARPVVVDSGRWAPLPLSIRLEVNHRPGTLRLFALLSPLPPTVDQIDDIVTRLHRLAPAKPGDPPWHVRLGGQGAVSTVCAGAGCESAELRFEIHGGRS